MIQKLLSASIVRYLAVAIVGVGLELALFWLMNSVMGISYLIATPLSTALVILFNWYASRKLVFNGSHHAPEKELFLVVAVSMIGIAIQLAVTVAAVELIKTTPFVGKMAAIGISFFWNYWSRRRFIYANNAQKESSNEV